MATGNIVQLAQFEGGNGLPAWQAIRAANNRRVVLLSNKWLDERLMVSGTWKAEREAYPAWTGTLIAYSEPGRKLEKQVVYSDPRTREKYVFPVKNGFEGESGLLAVEHAFVNGKPTFDIIQDGKDFVYVISGDAVVFLETRFPEQEGWHATSERGIPIGEQVSSTLNEARYLAQTACDGYAGLIARAYGCHPIDLDGRRHVISGRRPSSRFGALAVEAGPLAEGIMKK